MVVLVVLLGVAFDPLHPVPTVPSAAMFALQIVHSVPRLRRLRGPWTLGAQLLLFPWAGQGAPGMLAGSVLLIARGPVRWALLGAVVAAAGLLATADVYTCVNAMVNALTQGLIVFGVTRLRDLGAELHAARDELAEATVAEERRRSSRELESLLQSSLSAIVALAGQGRTGDVLALARRAAARARQAPPAPEPPSFDDLTPRLGVPILVTVHAGFSVVAAVFLVSAGLRPAPLAAALVCVGLGAGLQLRHSLPRPPGARPAHVAWTLPLQLVLTVGPLFLPGLPYPQMAGLAAGAFLVLWKRWAAFTGAGAVLLVTAVTLALRDVPPAENLYWTFNALAIGVMFYGLALHTDLVFQVRQARVALAGMALARERRRIFRDVHDLLGFSISAIVVKGELAARAPERAPEELADIAEIARRALADLAAIPGDAGPALSLETELASAREMLTAAGVTARVDPAVELPARADALLATVVREAVTNVLRHSRARHCGIEVEQDDGTTRLRVSNDGVDAAGEAGPGPGPGQGLGNLARRVAEQGGRLEATRTPGGFELTVLKPAGLGGDPDGVEPVTRV